MHACTYVICKLWWHGSFFRDFMTNHSAHILTVNAKGAGTCKTTSSLIAIRSAHYIIIYATAFADLLVQEIFQMELL